MDPLKTSSPPEAKLHFLDYWRIIRIRKTVILAVFLLVVITATIVTFILPEAYSSKAVIKVERDVNDVAGVADHPNMSGVYDPYFIQTEFEVIQSEKVLDKVIDKLDLNTAWQRKYGSDSKFKTSESRQALKRMIELRPERNTMLIDITVYSDNKQEAMQIANTVAEVYSDYRQEERKKLTLGGIEAFNQVLEVQDQKIKDQEVVLDKLRKDLNIVEMGDPNATGAGASIDPINVQHYNSIKIEAETSYVKEEKVLSKLKDLSPEELRQTIPTAAPDSILGTLLQDLNSAEDQLVTMRSDYGDQHPQVLRLMKLRDRLNHDIDERVSGILKGMEAKVAAAKAVVQYTEDKLYEAKTNDIARAEIGRPYYMAKVDLERLRKFRDVLALRTFQETVDIKMPKTMMVDLIEHAEAGARPVRPNKPLNIFLGIVIGLVVGVGLAFFIEYL
ncbi:MAG TPA: Wzz/FepE/Etk N-terminal domain-containing protein, partial [Verrucomicrobiae bacterium]|nr:Wzz/FepE/Etk N-terminal domain-containing protein [Verrucomicrobiae bacterium]